MTKGDKGTQGKADLALQDARAHVCELSAKLCEAGRENLKACEEQLRACDAATSRALLGAYEEAVRAARDADAMLHEATVAFGKLAAL